MAHCDWCGKERRGVVSIGRDANGEPDSPDVCFLCRKQNARGRVFDGKAGRYVDQGKVWRDMPDESAFPMPADIDADIPF